METNVTCKICGKNYYVCRVCSNIKSFTPWKTVADTLDHYTLYLVLHKYAINKDKNAAKEALSNIDLTDIETYVDTVKNTIASIMSAEPEYKQVVTDKTPEVEVVNENTKGTTDNVEPKIDNVDIISTEVENTEINHEEILEQKKELPNIQRPHTKRKK